MSQAASATGFHSPVICNQWHNLPPTFCFDEALPVVKKSPYRRLTSQRHWSSWACAHVNPHSTAPMNRTLWIAHSGSEWKNVSHSWSVVGGWEYHLILYNERATIIRFTSIYRQIIDAWLENIWQMATWSVKSNWLNWPKSWVTHATRSSTVRQALESFSSWWQHSSLKLNSIVKQGILCWVHSWLVCDVKFSGRKDSNA